MGLTGAIRAACRLAQPAVPRGRPGLTILAYHLVGAGTGSPVDLPEEVFEAQMREVAASGRAVSLSAALGAFERREPLPRDLVAVTFDDAYENFDRVARPVLERLAVPATLFVPTDFVDGRAPGPLSGAGSLPPTSWPRLREFAAGGLVELGSHSVSHPDLRALDEARLEHELEASAAVIGERTGGLPSLFCYPRGLVSERVERRVAARYRAAVAGGGGKNRPGRAHLARLERVSLRADMPSSLAPILGAGTVLEERLANLVRLARPRRPRA